MIAPPPMHRRRWFRPAALWAALFAVALLLDRPVYHLLLAPGTRHEDLAQVFRQLGYLPTWLIIALLVWIHDRHAPPRPRGLQAPGPARPPHHRAGLITLAALLAGALANILKPLIGRSRPDAEGLTHFQPRPAWLWGESGELGLGLPSGHTAVAFGACGMVALLFPAWRVPMLLLASGCALTRVLAGAHAFSDTVAAAGLGLAVAGWLHARGEGPRRGPGGGLLPPG